jgi:3-phenylpropionate/trans-cinnamate dioxygenase ferredoxin reductase subunit
MNTVGYLLIGGGVAAAEAAKQIRAKDPEGSITLVSSEPHVPYRRPPLSKELLSGRMAHEELFVRPEGFYVEAGINLVLGETVRRLDPVERIVTCSGGERIAFEKVLIATGGEPNRLRIPGSDLDGICYLRTLDDSLAIAAEAGRGKRAVIIGAGFIGMEVAATLAQMGVEVTVIETQPRIWSRFADPELAGFFQSYCADRGVRFLTEEMVAELRGEGRVSSVVTRSGREIACDFVCVGIGISPSVSLAEEAHLALGNGIVVNERLQTSHPDIYAAGDVVEYPDPVFGKRRRVEHFGHAEYTGQVAGLNMAGEERSYDMLTYVWSDIFDLHLEFAGDEGERDRTSLRGDFEDGSFTVLFLKQNRLTAYFAVNVEPTEYAVMRHLIRRKTDLAGRDKELADPASDLRKLLAG